MSTRSTIYFNGKHSATLRGDHNLTIHIFTDMHEPEETCVIELGCTACYCNYRFLMSDHLGNALAEVFKKYEH